MLGRLILVALVAACQPWYRDAEIAGRRATDQKHAAALVDEARSASGRGDHARAAGLLRRAVHDVPAQSADTYLMLAQESMAAFDVAGGRAVARHGMQLFPGDTRFRDVLVADKLADDLTADAIDAAGATTFAAAAANVPLAPHLDALSRALAADRGDTAAGELGLWLAHYGAPDHVVLRDAREQVARKILEATRTAPALSGLADAPARADAELAAGRLAQALALYSEVYRLLPRSELDAHLAGFATAAKQASDPAAIDAGVYELALAANRDAEAGLVGVAIRGYRKVIARAPWWIDAHRNLAALLEAAGRTEEAAHERAFADRLSR